MKIQLHKNARTTPAIRREVQGQPASVTDKPLAEAYHLHRHTVAKWRRRESPEEGSPCPPTLHATLNPAQEAVVVG